MFSVLLFTLVIAFAKETQSLEAEGEIFEVNQAIVNNTAEGERLHNEINSLLADPTISLEIKANLTAAIEREVAAERFRPLTLFSFSSLDGNSGNSRVEGLPAGVVCGKDCCTVVVPPIKVNVTRMVSYRCVKYSTQSYNKKCGSWGWKRCRRTRQVSRTGTCTRTEVKTTTRFPPCPEEHQSCCAGHFYFRDCCISIAKLGEILEKLKN